MRPTEAPGCQSLLRAAIQGCSQHLWEAELSLLKCPEPGRKTARASQLLGSELSSSLSGLLRSKPELAGSPAAPHSIFDTATAAVDRTASAAWIPAPHACGEGPGWRSRSEPALRPSGLQCWLLCTLVFKPRAGVELLPSSPRLGCSECGACPTAHSTSCRLG